MLRAVLAFALLSSLLGGCGHEVLSSAAPPLKSAHTLAPSAGIHPELTAALYDEPSRPVGQADTLVPEEGVSVQAKQLGVLPGARDAKQVPAFSLTDSEGSLWQSSEMVGTTPLVVVFFASWCELSARKVPIIARAVQKTGHQITLWVAVDDEATKPDIAGFLREQRLGNQPFIVGDHYPEFVAAYNPIRSIPLVVVIGKSGHLVDYQVGLNDDDGPRLEEALQAARLR